MSFIIGVIKYVLKAVGSVLILMAIAIIVSLYVLASGIHISTIYCLKRFTKGQLKRPNILTFTLWLDYSFDWLREKLRQSLKVVSRTVSKLSKL